MKKLLCALVTLLAACSPNDIADKVGRRAAETVVLPVVARYLPGPQADIATRCIVENATAEDIQTLARDVGVEAGTATVATVLRIASNPSAANCLARSGVSQFGVLR